MFVQAMRRDVTPSMIMTISELARRYAVTAAAVESQTLASRRCRASSPRYAIPLHFIILRQMIASRHAELRVIYHISRCRHHHAIERYAT